ncbi:RraA family protein [bacterium]|nr:MAG: RraA family protein [bacterium]
MQGVQVGDLSERLGACYTGAVYDILRERGVSDRVLPVTIRSISVGHKLAGPVFTVTGRRLDGLDPHETLLRWTEFLSAAPAGSVVVCQPNDSTIAHMGELSGETLLARGVRGYVVDGGCRDTEFLQGIGFPVWCRYFSPADVVGRWVPEAFQEPITIGGVRVSPGDFILADQDGVVVIPEAITGDVVTEIEALMRKENRVRMAIRAGMDPKEAYLTFGVF